MLLDLWKETENETAFVERLLAIMVARYDDLKVTDQTFLASYGMRIRRQDVVNDDVGRFLTELEAVMQGLRTANPGRHYVVSATVGGMDGRFAFVAGFNFGCLRV